MTERQRPTVLQACLVVLRPLIAVEAAATLVAVPFVLATGSPILAAAGVSQLFAMLALPLGFPVGLMLVLHQKRRLRTAAAAGLSVAIPFALLLTPERGMPLVVCVLGACAGAIAWGVVRALEGPRSWRPAA